MSGALALSKACTDQSFQLLVCTCPEGARKPREHGGETALDAYGDLGIRAVGFITACNGIQCM